MATMETQDRWTELQDVNAEAAERIFDTGTPRGRELAVEALLPVATGVNEDQAFAVLCLCEGSLPGSQRGGPPVARGYTAVELHRSSEGLRAFLPDGRRVWIHTDGTVSEEAEE